MNNAGIPLYYSLMEMVLEDVSLPKDFYNKSINESNLESLNEAQEALTKLGFNASKTNAIIVKTANKTVSTIKKNNGIDKRCKSEILENVRQMYKEIEAANTSMISVVGLSNTSKEKIKGLDKEKVSKSILLLIEIFIINTLMLYIFQSYLGPVFGKYFHGVLVAPITEEIGKQTAIRGGYAAEFTIIFNLAEFSLYMKNYAAKEGFEKMFKIRIAGVIVHVTNTIIQIITNNEWFQRKIGIDPEDPDSSEKCKFIGHLCGILIHSSWNAGLGYAILNSLGLA